MTQGQAWTRPGIPSSDIPRTHHRDHQRRRRGPAARILEGKLAFRESLRYYLTSL